MLQSEKKLRESSVINLSESLESLTENFEHLKQINNNNEGTLLDSEVKKYSNIIFASKTIEEIKVSEQNIVYYIIGYCVFKIFPSNKDSCLSCKRQFSGNRMETFSSLVDSFNKGGLCHPTLFIMQKAFALDYILNALCFHKDTYKLFFQSKFDKFDLIMKLFATQIEIDDLKCLDNHILKKYIMRVFRIYTNLFLKRYSESRNDFRSEYNIRKLLNFNPEADVNSDNE